MLLLLNEYDYEREAFQMLLASGTKAYTESTEELPSAEDMNGEELMWLTRSIDAVSMFRPLLWNLIETHGLKEVQQGLTLAIKGDTSTTSAEALAPIVQGVIGHIIDGTRPDDKARETLHAYAEKSLGDVIESIWLTMDKEDPSRCHYCGGRIVEGDEVHPGYTGWPCCEDCKAV